MKVVRSTDFYLGPGFLSSDFKFKTLPLLMRQEQSLFFSHRVAVTAPTYPRRNKQTYRNSLQPAIAELRKSRKSCDGVGLSNASDWVGTGGMGKRNGHDLIRLLPARIRVYLGHNVC